MADVFEEEVEQTVSIHEYLKDVEEQELEADLVLGGDEGKECTYTNGYMKRQAIFSCLTCTPDGNAGVCTACSLSCHDGHEIVELWTKRNFRCDCGNSKFGDFFCKLLADKDIENVENSYNHNFKGLYCTCGRPYPDPDAEEQVEMIQCCVCEDWFHEEHSGLESSDEVPRDEGVPLYEDFICGNCSVVCGFLTLYPQIIQVLVSKPDVMEDSISEKIVFEDSPSFRSSGKLENHHDISEDNEEKDHTLIDGSSEIMSAGKDLMPGENSQKVVLSDQCVKDTSQSGTCILGVDLAVTSPMIESNKPFFLTKNWRDTICKCDLCLNFYNQKHIGFLTDKEDSIVEYEKLATQKREEKLQEREGVELDFLNNMGHVQKLEVLNGISDMKNEIHTFLESFDASKAVTSDDIQRVFENLAKKRRRE